MSEVSTPPDLDSRWLRQFLRWITPFNLAFAALQLLAFAAYRELSTGLTGAVLLACSGILLVAGRQVRRGAETAAVQLIAVAMLVAAATIAVVQPWLVPTLALIPLLSVALALPYLSGRLLRRLLVGAWLTTTLVVGLSGASRLAPSLPDWFTRAFQGSSLVTTVTLILLLLWQFSSRLRAMLAQTRAAQARYTRAAEGATDGLWDWDLQTGHIYYSPRWQTMLGYAAGELGSDPEAWLGRLHADDAERVRAELAVHLAGLTDHFESEYRLRAADGRYRWLLGRGLAVRDADGQPIQLAGSQTDITRRKLYEAQLHQAARRDTLTGLPNRTAFLEALSQAVVQVKRHPAQPRALLFLDLDDFKVVNDSLGHGAGDALLVAVGERLQGCLRASDTLARLGGDEFTILLAEAPQLRDVVAVVARIQAALDLPFTVGGVQVFTSTSVGIAWVGTPAHQPEEVLRAADSALYHAKQAGKRQWALFDEAMHVQAMRRLQIETELRRALAQGELRVLYQPLVTLASGALHGVEALLRWQHPTQGLLEPARFLPVAAEAGLLAALDRWVLQAAATEVARWQAAQPTLVLSVNLSGAQFAQADLLAQVAQASAQLTAGTLCLELSEEVVMEHRAAAARLAQVRALGVTVAIDDFGMGYSSLAKLDQLPLDALKIDQLFMQRVTSGTVKVPVIESLVALAAGLGLAVVAEGIETPAQLAYLQARGAPVGQGYLFAPPLDAAAVPALWQAEPPWAACFAAPARPVAQA